MASVTEQVNSMNPAAPISLLVKHCGAAAGELLDRGLRAAGLLVVVAPTVYDAVIEAERATGSLRHLICCVDYFGRDDFRLFRLVRREWPKTVIVAHYSPGFEYKGRLAELVGADVILGCLEDIANFVEGLAPSAAPTEPEPSRPLAGVSQAIAALRSTAPVAKAPKPAPPHPTAPVEPPARPAPEPPPPPPPSAPTGLPPPAAYQYLARDPEPPPAANASSPPPSAPPAEVKPAAASPRLTPAAEAVAALLRSPPPRPAPGTATPQPPAQPPAHDELAGGDVIGTVELTDEELRLLLGEEEEA